MAIGKDAVGTIAFLVEAIVAALALVVGIAKPKIRRLIGSRLGFVVAVITLVLGASGSIVLAITIVAVIIATALVPAL